jgi:hypothetical protein
MTRFLLSLLVAFLIGLGIALYIGWVQFPRQRSDSTADMLDQRYQDEYAVMIAQGFLAENDVTSALERLRLLQVENVPAYVQDVTERFITTSRSIDDIRALVALSEGLGRLTPIMEPYRPLPTPGF